MAPRLGRRLVRVVKDALLERDRAEMRAVNALLTVIEPPRHRRAKTRRRHPSKCRPA